MRTFIAIGIMHLALFGLLPAAELSVPGDANIFGAGHAFVPNPGGGSGGILPPVYHLAADETILSFTVTGSNTLTAEFGYNSPDGNYAFPSQVYS